MASTTSDPGVEDYTQESRPANAIEAAKVDITVTSSLYRLDDKGTPTCIVVLEISFNLGEGMGLAYAAVPLDLKAYEILPAASVSALMPLTSATFHLHDYFTSSREERIIVEQYQTHETTTVEPNAQIGVLNMATVAFSGVGKKKDRTKMIKEVITLVGQRRKNCMQVKWTFGNEWKKHYPRNVRLMIIVKKTVTSRNPYFPFYLKLGKGFRVSVFGGTFNDRLKQLFRSADPKPIPITGDWDTKIAERALADIPGFEDYGEMPRYIGLRAAQPSTPPDT